jgi:hypothetical protein
MQNEPEPGSDPAVGLPDPRLVAGSRLFDIWGHARPGRVAAEQAGRWETDTSRPDAGRAPSAGRGEDGVSRPLQRGHMAPV